MKVLGEAVILAMCDGLNMSPAEIQEVQDMTKDTFWVMRLIGISLFLLVCISAQQIKLTEAGYPPLPDGQEGISCGEHKDYGCLTLVLFPQDVTCSEVNHIAFCLRILVPMRFKFYHDPRTHLSMGMIPLPVIIQSHQLDHGSMPIRYQAVS